MQVYAALYDNSGLILIAQKREFNQWHVLVNQAGQFCLPGGKVKKDTLIDAARREFKEETGRDIPAHDTPGLWERKGYALVCFNITSSTSILDLQQEINANLSPNPLNQNGPKSEEVVDWELQCVLAVSSSVVGHFLGVPEPMSAQAQQAAKDVKQKSQSIDWYAEIADYLQKTI